MTPRGSKPSPPATRPRRRGAPRVHGACARGVCCSLLSSRATAEDEQLVERRGLESHLEEPTTADLDAMIKGRLHERFHV